MFKYAIVRNFPFFSWWAVMFLTDALDESSERTERTETPKELYASSLNYLAEQFETYFTDIIQRLQQLDYSSNDFVSSNTFEKKKVLS